LKINSRWLRVSRNPENRTGQKKKPEKGKKWGNLRNINSLHTPALSGWGEEPGSMEKGDGGKIEEGT